MDFVQYNSFLYSLAYLLNLFITTVVLQGKVEGGITYF
jgi:hypothetical protein